MKRQDGKRLLHEIGTICTHSTSFAFHVWEARTYHPSPTIPLLTDASPLVYVFLFLIDTIWGYLVAGINANAAIRLRWMPTRRRLIFRGWRDVTLQEVRTRANCLPLPAAVQQLNSTANSPRPDPQTSARSPLP